MQLYHIVGPREDSPSTQVFPTLFSPYGEAKQLKGRNHNPMFTSCRAWFLHRKAVQQRWKAMQSLGKHVRLGCRDYTEKTKQNQVCHFLSHRSATDLGFGLPAYLPDSANKTPGHSVKFRGHTSIKNYSLCI